MVLLILFTLFFSLTTLAECLISYKIPVSNELKKRLGYPEGTYLNFAELASKQGYTAGGYNVTTEDGYILTMFHMKSPNCTEYKNNSILLVHGLTINGDEFLDAGVGVGWPYLLADSCYDVWVGNHRGNNYARTHLTLNPDKDDEFWDYSVDEMAKYDVPAMIDCVLNTTQTDNLTYIGYSLGGNTGIVACADRPEYNDKINLFVGLAPVTKLMNMTSPFKLVLLFFYYFDNVLQRVGFKKVFYEYSILNVLSEFVCHYKSAYGFCSAVKTIIMNNYHPGSVTESTVQVFASHFLMGTSERLMAHYAQIAFSGEFLRYDFGSEGNLLHYGNTTAPGYNLTNVVVPSVLITGQSDHLVHYSNVEWLAEQLRNLVETVILDNPLMDHVDMVYSKYIPTQIYPKIKDYLEKYSSS